MGNRCDLIGGEKTEDEEFTAELGLRVLFTVQNKESDKNKKWLPSGHMRKSHKCRKAFSASAPCGDINRLF